MSRFVVSIQVLGTLAAVFLAGCGGSGAGSGGSSFAARADAACRARNDAQVAATQSFAPTAAGAATFTGKLAAAYQTEISSLRALSPPDTARSAFAAFIHDQQLILGHIQTGVRAAKANDPASYTAAQNAALSLAVQSFPKAAAAGLTICAERLPASDVSAIKSLAVRGAVHPTASLCTTSVTREFLATTFRGSVSTCERNIVKSHASSAQVTTVYGILPSATAYLTQQGTSPPKLELTLLKQNGTWKVNSVRAQP